MLIYYKKSAKKYKKTKYIFNFNYFFDLKFYIFNLILKYCYIVDFNRKFWE